MQHLNLGFINSIITLKPYFESVEKAMPESCLVNHDAPENAQTCQEDYIVIESISIDNERLKVGDSELGFGTEYEKVLFAEIIFKIAEKYGINSFFNFPKNKLLGNTKDVTKSLVEKNYNPDLLWNFCEFENEHDIRTILQISGRL